ncbi:MAG: DAK2 domain-containing protein [Clostridiales bacterium]|nr:DAK2 domain-containing protein [Clostridiales bacterium]
MGEFTINGVMLRDMLLMGASVLEHNKASIDALNVFPVPDGDTGTNMLMTMQSAAKSIKSCSCESVSEVADALSNGALRGARGNSGVILSQIFRGFSKALKGEQELTAKLLVKTFTSGTESAYKAVMRP